MKIGRGEIFTGRAFLILLILITILPFISIFLTALHPSGTVPNGFAWPDDPQWGNFIEAFKINLFKILITEIWMGIKGTQQTKLYLIKYGNHNGNIME